MGGPQPVVVPELALREADLLPGNCGSVAERDGDGTRAGIVKRTLREAHAAVGHASRRDRGACRNSLK